MTSPEQQKPTSDPDSPHSGALEHFMSEFERIAAQHNQEPGNEDPEPDVTG